MIPEDQKKYINTERTKNTTNIYTQQLCRRAERSLRITNICDDMYGATFNGLHMTQITLIEKSESLKNTIDLFVCKYNVHCA
jgi:hypothetical protein